MVFDATSSNIDEVLSINPCANVFVFRNFNINQKDWLTYSFGNDRPSELCYNVTTLLRWLTFLLQSLILTVMLFWIFSFFLNLVFVLQQLSLHWKILIMLLSQFPLTFFQTLKGMSLFTAQLTTI